MGNCVGKDKSPKDPDKTPYSPSKDEGEDAAKGDDGGKVETADKQEVRMGLDGGRVRVMAMA